MSQESIKTEQVLKEQLEYLREKNRDLEDAIKRKEAMLEMVINQRKNDNIKVISNRNTENLSLDLNHGINYGTKKNDTANQKTESTRAPTLDYELTRRRLRRDINEFWLYLKGIIDKSLKEKSNTSNLFQQALLDGQHRHSTLHVILSELANHDGFQDWRETEHKELSDLMQKRLHSLQNPRNCSKARYSLCRINKGCGLGCELHHVVYCFIVSYATERTLILDSRKWNYKQYKAGGAFEDIFKPLSDTCVIDLNDPKAIVITSWPGKQDSRIVEIPFIDRMKPHPDFLPPSIPEDLAPRLVRLHGNPIVWWIGQFFKYLLRPQEDTLKLYKEAEKERDLSKPMVGVHIRRTDKIIKEAKFHGIEEYMAHVEAYFQQLEVKQSGTAISPKQVFIASDDPKVFTECRKKYPDYTFLGDESRAKSASMTSRFNFNSLKKTMVDIYMLSRSDYIVCTLSSNLGRLAYEIQQQRYPDGSWRLRSLDDIWYFAGGDNQHEVILPHTTNNSEEVDLELGDILNSLGNHWDGYSKGTIKERDALGMYPLYKTKPKVKVAKFPTYSHVKL